MELASYADNFSYFEWKNLIGFAVFVERLVFSPLICSANRPLRGYRLNTLVNVSWLGVERLPMGESALKGKNNMTTQSIYDFTVNTIDHKPLPLSEFEGKTLLVVNVASKCGFTSQYQGLQALYDKYKDKNFVVLGFPCNQFGSQEPGNEEEIQSFCELNFGVNFPLFEKLDVNGEGAHPFYQYLKSQSKGILGTEGIKWNFTKFLVDKNGKVVDRYAPTTSPGELEGEIERVLGI